MRESFCEFNVRAQVLENMFSITYITLFVCHLGAEKTREITIMLELRIFIFLLFDLINGKDYFERLM